MIYGKRKYGNKKIENALGIFDSSLEYKRFLVLKDAEREGTIYGLRRQVEFELIPNQYRKRLKQLKTKVKEEEYLAERKASYFADFVYQKGDQTVVEDTKGLRLADYILKRKMMLYFHNIEIREVKKATELV